MKGSTKIQESCECDRLCGQPLSAVTVAAAVRGVALLSSIAALPAGISLESIAAFSGSVVVASGVENSRLNKKARKSDNIRKYAETVLRSNSQITSRAPDDGIVTDSEYQPVLDEVERFAD